MREKSARREAQGYILVLLVLVLFILDTGPKASATSVGMPGLIVLDLEGRCNPDIRCGFYNPELRWRHCARLNTLQRDPPLNQLVCRGMTKSGPGFDHARDLAFHFAVNEN